MNPKNVVKMIQIIANKLASSNNPSKSLVLNDLNNLIHRLSSGTIRPPISKDGSMYIFDDDLGRYVEFHPNEVKPDKPNKLSINSNFPEFIELREGGIAWLDDNYPLDNNGYGPVYYHKDRMHRKHWLDKNGKHFRPDGPAMVTRDKEYYFRKPEELHNEEGPAIMDTRDDNNDRYYLNGVEITKSEWEKNIEKTKLPKRIISIEDENKSDL